MQKRLLHLLPIPTGRALGDAARTMVARERMLADQVPRRLAWYRSLWERREELHRALLERVPELDRAPAEAAEGTAMVLPED